MSIQVIPETRKKNGSLTTIKLLIELNKHKIDVDKEEYSSKKYDIRFSDKVSCKGPTWFEMRSILGEKFQRMIGGGGELSAIGCPTSRCWKAGAMAARAMGLLR